MVINKSIVKLFIFDLDGTLYNLAVDWEIAKPYLAKDLSLLKNEESINKIKLLESEGVEKGVAVEGALDILNVLSKQHDITIISRNFHETIEASLVKIGFMGDVRIIGRDDVLYQKPHIEGVKKALSQSNVSRQEAIFVGDTFHDIEAAQGAGIKSVIIRNARNSYIPEGADLYIDKLAELISIED